MRSASFEGKVGAVTGAASGIGRSLAVALARQGCALALCDLDGPGLEETARLAGGARVTTRRLDVTDEAGVVAWAGEVVRDHGGVNLVFNNAGIAHAGTVAGTSDADFHRVLDVNFWGVVHGTRAFLPHLEASGDGHVINLSSVFGLIACPAQAPYNASKFAVRGFTEALQLELAMTGSRVFATSVHPGGVRTNIHRAARIDPSLASLGLAVDGAADAFERLLSLDPDRAAAIILRGVRANRRRVLVGRDAVVIDLVQRLLPTGYQVLVNRLVRRLTTPGAG